MRFDVFACQTIAIIKWVDFFGSTATEKIGLSNTHSWLIVTVREANKNPPTEVSGFEWRLGGSNP